MRSSILLTLAIVFLLSSCNLPPGKATIEIRSGWEFRQAPSGDWHRAEVPGCVHTDCARNGLIPDPFYGGNERDAQWIEREDWEYRTEFDVTKELLAQSKVELDFTGLDTYADVFLNDSLLIEADNMFRDWRASCKGLLREKRNALRVYFHSPVEAVEERWSALRPELPGGPRVLTRKAAYQYGWDFAPRLVTSGIWRPVYLRAWDGARITGLWIATERVTADEARLSARFEIESDEARRVTLSIYCGNKGRGRVEVDLHAGRNDVALDFSIPSPKLWWTNGLGRPNLYHFLGEMRTGGEIVDWAERRVGIRTIELVRTKDEAGESFYFRLNGVPVFMKGANFVPADCFPSRVTRERYEALVGNAELAGMNMLRVWGGGIYEDDAFYDLCDELGILVWQDFMFACAMYPGDDAFLGNVEHEAAENVTRLRNHPCLALWCGNNEIDEAWHHWGWQRQFGYSATDSATVWADYGRLFNELLPRVVETFDPSTPYVTSSPTFGRADPRSMREGDSHYWGVWHDGEPIATLSERVPRFMSEFGFQSYPSFSTIAAVAPPGEDRIDSEAMRSHQRHPRGEELIETYLERNYRTPRDFKSLVYVSQLLQADAVRTGIEAHRRAKPSCMGSLYWQLDDCWPAVSWSSIDYCGTPKAAYYAARNAFSEILVSPIIEEGEARVFAVSDRLEPVDALAELKLLDFSGDLIWVENHIVHVPANSSRCFFEADVGRLLRGRAPAGVVLCAELREGEELLSRNLLYFAPPKELDLPPFLPEEALSGRAAVSIASLSENEEGYSITLCARTLVKNLFLSVEGHEGIFDDNYFDMLPGSCVTVHFVTPERIERMDRELRMMSLVDTY
jgi:beta-mannosidase